MVPPISFSHNRQPLNSGFESRLVSRHMLALSLEFALLEMRKEALEVHDFETHENC